MCHLLVNYKEEDDIFKLMYVLKTKQELNWKPRVKEAQEFLIEIFDYGWNYSVILPHSTDHIVFADYPSAMAEDSVETIKGMNLWEMCKNVSLKLDLSKIWPTSEGISLLPHSKSRFKQK